MTSDLVSLPLILLAGFGLGLFFYGGLWFTIRALSTSRHPALLMLASFWTRTAAVIAGFYFLMDRRWQNAVVCLAGFVVARMVCTRRVPHAPARKGVA